MLLHNGTFYLTTYLKPDSQLVILLIVIFSSWRIQMSGLADNRFSQVYASMPFACYSSSRHPPAEEIFADKRFADWEPELRSSQNTYQYYKHILILSSNYLTE
jgi:hypothetical protein